MITHFAGRRVRYAILFHELLDAVWRVLLISENTAGLLSALLPGSTDIDAYSFVMSGGQISIRPSLPLRLLSLPLSFVRHSKFEHGASRVDLWAWAQEEKSWKVYDEEQNNWVPSHKAEAFGQIYDILQGMQAYG